MMESICVILRKDLMTNVLEVTIGPLLENKLFELVTGSKSNFLVSTSLLQSSRILLFVSRPSVLFLSEEAFLQA